MRENPHFLNEHYQVTTFSYLWMQIMLLFNFYLHCQSSAAELNMSAIWRLDTICCMRPETLELEVFEIKNMQVLSEVLQLFLPARCRLEVTSGTIRVRCLPRVCQ